MLTKLMDVYDEMSVHQNSFNAYIRTYYIVNVIIRKFSAIFLCSVLYLLICDSLILI